MAPNGRVTALPRGMRRRVAGLVLRHVITTSRIDMKLGMPGALRTVTFNFRPPAVVLNRTWHVAKKVLASQFTVNVFNRRNRAVVIHGGVHMPVGNTGQFIKRSRCASFLRDAGKRIVQTGDIDLNVGLLQILVQLLLGIPAAVIASVGDDNHRFLQILHPLFEVFRSKIHRVPKGCVSLGLDAIQHAVNIVKILNRRICSRSATNNEQTAFVGGRGPL